MPLHPHSRGPSSHSLAPAWALGVTPRGHRQVCSLPASLFDPSNWGSPPLFPHLPLWAPRCPSPLVSCSQSPPPAVSPTQTYRMFPSLSPAWTFL